jgi:hypothetical protein
MRSGDAVERTLKEIQRPPHGLTDSRSHSSKFEFYKRGVEYRQRKKVEEESLLQRVRTCDLDPGGLRGCCRIEHGTLL